MRIESDTQLIGGIFRAQVRLPAELLTAVEREVITQQGAIEVNLGGLISDSSVTPVLVFSLPAQTCQFPSCLPVSVEFDSATLGAQEASNRAQAWIRSSITRINSAYAIKAAINPGPIGMQITQVQYFDTTEAEATIPLNQW